MALPPQAHFLQATPYSAPWTPLADQAIPQPHTEGGPARATIFAGWGEGGAELTREIADYVDARAGDMVEEDDKPKRDLKRFQGDMRKRLEGLKSENRELRQALIKMDRKLDAMTQAVGAKRVASPVQPVAATGTPPQRSPAMSPSPDAEEEGDEQEEDRRFAA